MEIEINIKINIKTKKLINFFKDFKNLIYFLF